jgi:hypothetical protein
MPAAAEAPERNGNWRANGLRGVHCAGAPNRWRRRTLALMCGATLAMTVTLAVAAGVRSARADGPTVYLNQPRLNEPVRPASVFFGESASATATLRGLSWSSWGGDTAAGSGQAFITWLETGSHHGEATVPVIVTAGGRQECGGLSVYTTVEMQLAPGQAAPPHFTAVQRDKEIQRCQIHAGSYVAGHEERTDPRGCFFAGLSHHLLFRHVGSFPSGIFYCAMRWKGWGSATATGVGVARKGEQQYGLRVVLSDIRWCTPWGVSYTRETAELWGDAERFGGQGNVTRRAAAHLEFLIGRAGQPHRRAHDSAPASAHCIGGG